MKRSLTSLLGLAFGDDTLTAVWARSAEGQVRVSHVLRAPFSLDPTSNDTERAGRELRDLLANAGIRETRCIVCLPVKWAFSLHTDLPDISGEDLDSYLRIQAEREFPFPQESLSLSVSQHADAAGTRRATLVAIPSDRLVAIHRLLQQAHLKPIRFAMGVVALAGAHGAEGTVTLLEDESGTDMAISGGGHVVALRHLAAQALDDEEKAVADPLEITRQVRISLGQLTPEVSEGIQRCRVFCSPDRAEVLSEALAEPLGRLGLSLERGEEMQEFRFPHADGQEDAPPGVMAVLASTLRSRPPEFTFAPPIASRWRRFTGRVSSRAAVWVVSAALALCMLLTGLFAWQHITLRRLESAWRMVEADAGEAQATQDRIRQFRAWFDDSPTALVVLCRITEAFPEEGSVWATQLAVEYPEGSRDAIVECSGKARSNDAWLETLERLRQTDGVRDLRFQQARGEDPMQFTLKFRWATGGQDGV